MPDPTSKYAPVSKYAPSSSLPSSQYAPSSKYAPEIAPTPNVWGQAWEQAKSVGGNVLGTVGTVLRPLGAPQQVLFGALSGNLERGLKSAASDLTWGGAYGDTPRITGSELVQQARGKLSEKGAPDWIDSWGGVALDVVLDPTLILSAGAGLAGRAAKGASLAGDAARAARFGRVAGALEKTAAVTGFNVGEGFRALPVATREKMAQGLYNSVLGREIGSDGGFIARQSVGDFLLPKTIQTKVFPAQVARFVQSDARAQGVARAAGNLIGDRVQGLEQTYDKVLAGVPKAGREEFRSALNQFVTFENPAQFTQGLADINSLGAKHGIDQQALWDMLTHTTAVNTFSSGIMEGTNKSILKMFQDRLGIDAATVQGAARLEGETVRTRLQLPDQQAVLGVNNPNYSRFAANAQAQAAQDLTAVPTVSLSEILQGDSVRRGLNRQMAVYGVDGQAHIDRLMASGRARSVDPVLLEQAVTQVMPTGGRQIAQHMTGEIQGGANLLDAVVSAKNQFGLNQQAVEDLLSSVRGTNNAYVPSSSEAARAMSQLRADSIAGVQAIGARQTAKSMAKERLVLTEQQLSDLGEVKDVLVNAHAEAAAVGAEVSFQAKTLAAKRFLETEGLYIKPMADLPTGVRMNEGRAAPGYRMVDKAMETATGGVLESGAIVPDYVWREFQVSTKMGGPAGSSVLQSALSRWQVVKLSNPATIVQNVFSNFIQAASYGPGQLNPVQLVRGLALHAKESDAMRLERIGTGLADFSGDLMGLRGKAADIKAGLAGSTPSWGRDFAQGFDDLIGREITKGPAYIPRVADLASGGATYIGRNLFAGYKATEDRMRAAAYYAYKGQGKTAQEAADLAQNVFFDYSARPGVIDSLNKLGLPFQTYPNLASWRVLETMYEKPGLVAAQTRAVTNVRNERNNPQEIAVAQDYITKQFPVRIGQDSQGRGIYVTLGQFLPMGAGAALLDNVNGSMLGPVATPPMLALGQAVFQGRGFQGRAIYDGLGSSDTPGFSEAFTGNPSEAVRRFSKALWEFGVYPWAPGSAVASRLTQAIVRNGRTLAEIEADQGLAPNSLQDIASRVGANGPFLWSEGDRRVTPYGRAPKKNAPGEPASDVGWVAARVAGLRNVEVQGDPNVRGTADAKRTTLAYELRSRTGYWTTAINKAAPVDKPRLAQARDEELAALRTELSKLQVMAGP